MALRVNPAGPKVCAPSVRTQLVLPPRLHRAVLSVRTRGGELITSPPDKLA